ncbi:MAG: hypothetical protein ACM4AI_12990 [Acidobacteriota bacterium]
MRALMVALGLVLLVALSTVDVATRPAMRKADRVQVKTQLVPMPSSVPAGVEVLLLVR